MKDSGCLLSYNTLYKILKQYNITNWLAKKRPKLTPEVVKLRLAWAKAHVDWEVDQWRYIIWSDECSIERGLGQKRRWVFRLPSQKWEKQMIQEYKKGKDLSVMI